MLTQDIGVQGYSTLHCIRFRGFDIKMATPLKQVEHALASMNVEHPQATPTSPPVNGKDGQPTPPVHHRFYVYCKRPCAGIAPGKLRVRCADCKDASFLLLVVSPCD